MQDPDSEKLIFSILGKPKEPEIEEDDEENLPAVIEDLNLFETTNEADHFKDIVANFSSVQSLVLQRFADDRKQVDKVIQYLEEQVINSITTPKAYMVEQLVSAVRARGELTMGTAKMLDSFAKMMASMKGTNLVQNVNLNNIDVNNILDSKDD